MARQARLPGEYLHVIVRGIGKQVLFEEDADRRYFLSLLQRCRDDCKIVVLAYCLMENHVHLLLRDTNGSTPLFMKKIGVSYAGFYNRKYERVGHLFQDRYKSEIITDDVYLLAVYRYILNNPREAGISDSRFYPWSSFHEYGKSEGLTDSSLLSSMIGSKDKLVEFLEAPDENEYMEETSAKHDDVWAIGVICQALNVSSGTVLQQMAKADRDEALANLKAAGITIRQLERLTGINRGIIQKAKRVKENRPH